MKSYQKGLIFATLVLFIGGVSLGGETLTQFGDVKGRSFHAELYEEQPCTACHNTEKPTAFPADDVCLTCHDLEDVVAATARVEDEKWQNPHNNLHYGKDVPCMECHGEHETRKPLCQGCHSFKYPKYIP